MAGTSMRSQCKSLGRALRADACSMSSGANRPTTSATGSVPFSTKDGSTGRKKCLGLDGQS